MGSFAVLPYTLTMDPDQFDGHSADEEADAPTNPTPPEGIPRVVSAYEEPGEPDSQPDSQPDEGEGFWPHEPDEATTPDLGEPEEAPGPVYDTEYQPDRALPKRRADVPFWAWLAIPVALVLGIILVLVFGPLSRPNQPTAAGDQTPVAGAPGASDQPSRDPGSKDLPLPLVTPAPPGKFRVASLAVFSGPDDVQLNPGSVVTPDTRLTFRLSYTGAQLKDQVEVKWEVNDRDWGSEIVHLNPWTTTQWFTRDRPESGWPEGRYRLTVMHEDKEESSIFFEVNPTGQPADPAAATFPADDPSAEATDAGPQGGAGSGVEGSTSESEFSFPGN